MTVFCWTKGSLDRNNDMKKKSSPCAQNNINIHVVSERSSFANKILQRDKDNLSLLFSQIRVSVDINPRRREENVT